MSYLKSQIIIDPQIPAKQVWVDEFNALRAQPLTRLVGCSFVGNTKDTNFWAETDAGSGTVTQSGGLVTLATGTTANSTTQYQTAQTAHWVPGMANTFRASLRVGDTGTTNNTRNWGMFTTTDGFYFQLTGTTLNIGSRTGSADTVVAQSSWNGGNSFTLDTNFHIWEIQVTYADVHFFIDHILMHTLKPTTSYFAQTLNLPVTLQNNNSGGSITNVNMYAGVAFIMRSGQLETESKYSHINTATTTVLKYGAGRLHKIIVNTSVTETVTVYDNTVGSGTEIAVLTLSTAGNPLPFFLEYDCPFNTGLTVVTSSTADLTFVYE